MCEPQAFLVIRTSSSDENFDIVLDELGLELLEGFDNALERSGNVGEVGDATTNDEDLAFLVLFLGHQPQNGFGVLVGLLLARGTRVLAVVGQLGSGSQVTNRVRVNDRSA